MNMKEKKVKKEFFSSSYRIENFSFYTSLLYTIICIINICNMFLLLQYFCIFRRLSRRIL